MRISNAAVDLRHIDCGDVAGNVVTRSSKPIPSGTEDAGTSRVRRIWTAGDYDRIAAGFRHEAEAFIARLGARPGSYVLDAASGSGNLTIPLARTGAHVFGIDVALPLLKEAKAWADREALKVTLDEGSVESLPYADRAFDLVVSMFGVMFATRPEPVVAELARVTKKGGTVAMANWTRDGFVGRMLKLHAEFVPPPAGVPSPLLWADEGALSERFPAKDWALRFVPRTLTFRFPHTPAGTAELFRGSYGPTVLTMQALDEDRRAEFNSRLREHWERHQVSGASGTVVESEYLEVLATRR